MTDEVYEFHAPCREYTYRQADSCASAVSAEEYKSMIDKLHQVIADDDLMKKYKYKCWQEVHQHIAELTFQWSTLGRGEDTRGVSLCDIFTLTYDCLGPDVRVIMAVSREGALKIQFSVMT